MKVLVAVADAERDRPLLDMAAALARDGEVILASVIEVTGDAALTSAQPEARARRRLLDTLAADMGATHARSLVTVARVGWDAIRDACATERPDLLLVSWNRPGWDILGTTIEYAHDGFPVTEVIAEGWAKSKAKLSKSPDAFATYFPDGKSPKAGDVFRNPNLGRVYEQIAREGPQIFYNGAVAKKIAT